MKKDLTRDLAIAASFKSSVSGGISLPRVHIDRLENRYEMTLIMPTVDPKNFSIDIVNQFLLIFKKFNEAGSINVPHLIQKLKVPIDVALEEVHARHNGRSLIVSMPFNELAGGYHRHIDIDPSY